MKRLLAGICVAGIVTGSAGAVVSEMTPPPEQEKTLVTTPSIDYTSSADVLHGLGLFQGIGYDAKGKPIYDLGARCTRAEAAVMLMRLLGLEEEAKTAPASPFTDLQGWQKPAVNVLYQKGMISGASADKFEPESACTLEMYATFMLRALGYSDKAGDFSFESAPLFAMQIGLADNFSYDLTEFRRDEAAQMSRMALDVKPKGSQETLLTQLVNKGVVAKEKAEALYQGNQKILDVLKKTDAAVPYAADVLATLMDDKTGSTMSLEGKLVDHGTQAVLHGTLFTALDGSYSVPQRVTVVRDSNGIAISPLANGHYRDDQVAALLRESNLLSLVMSAVPARSLLEEVQVSGDTVILPVSAGAAKLRFAEGGTLAERTVSMKLHNVSYNVSAKTTESGNGVKLLMPTDTWKYIQISHMG